ncbi:hypothetical protein L596_022323 [Steinernema carpocapsae]|uniref:Uncharacterized protein n=1 Tax=Steinernema carpocapsae TaxID=34508 RepID=A0A4U5MLB7_STECR|nr:hypothetical protein L596_022323 [Steinernema carpocapsae]
MQYLPAETEKRILPKRLATPGRLLELQEDLKPTNLDVVALTELGWKQCGALELQDSDFIFFHAGPQRSSRNRRTGFMVHKRLKNKIHGFHQVAPRISRMDLKLRDQGLRLIAAYAPPTGSSRSRKNRRRRHRRKNDEEAFGIPGSLREELQAEPSTFTILLGDFATSTRLSEAEARMPKKKPLSASTDTANATEEDNCSSNSAKNSASVERPTASSPASTTFWRQGPSGFKKATVMSSHNAGSDHRLLRATIQDQARPEGRRPTPRPNAKKQIDKDLFRMAVAMNPPKPPADDASGYQDLSTAFKRRRRSLKKKREADCEGSKARRLPAERNSATLKAASALCYTEEEMQRAVQVFYNNLYAPRIQVEGDATPEEEEDDYPAFLQAEIDEAMQDRKKPRTRSGHHRDAQARQVQDPPPIDGDPEPVPPKRRNPSRNGRFKNNPAVQEGRPPRLEELQADLAAPDHLQGTVQSHFS